MRHARLTQVTLAGAMVLLCTGCFATPLSRSYDDAYNAPLPNEVPPPTLNQPQIDCSRNPHDCDLNCVEDKDCKDGEICYQNVCMVGDAPPL